MQASVFTRSIVAIVLVYTWVVAPMTPRWMASVASLLVVAVAVWRALRTGEWGLDRQAFVPATATAALVTVAGAGIMYVAGSHVGTWHARREAWRALTLLVPWALGQQFALQTVLLREAQSRMSTCAAIGVASLLFAAFHLPNPFLTAVTFVGALVWCTIYSRFPNVIPLALSHAIATVVILQAFDEAVTGHLLVGVAYLR
jgi:membrane protease YdiL (CAAX protease family)